MVEFDVDMGYLLECDELDKVVLNDEDGEHEPMEFVPADATVGTEPDEPDMLKLHDRMNAALLDMQKELLAYHPRDRENASLKKLIDCVIAAHQIIEDAATVGTGTCKNTQDDFDFMCSECGKCVDNGRVLGFKFCPQCGRKIKEEAE